jgi:hypothetical protein
MQQAFEIAEGLIGLAIILGFIGWGSFRLLKKSYDPAKVLLKWVIALPLVVVCFVVATRLGPFGPFVMVFIGVMLSILWTPHLAEALFNPLTNLFDGGTEAPELKPYYSIAISRRKQGKFLEAIVEIRRQLARFPADFEGVSLLANIQAEDLQDLPGAEITLNHFCDRPGAPPQQVAAACSQLADWHLKLARDADSARAALEKIIARFPGTDLSLLAAQRIAHLGGAEKVLLAAQDRQPLAVPEGIKNIGLRGASAPLAPRETDPAQLADTYVKHLEQYPLDAEIREKLAVLYADHYQRLDLATRELEQLSDQPNQPTKRVAHWLNLLADLQIRHGADHDTVRGTLEKIGERFPDTAAAAMAQNRLDHLRRELKGQKETPGVKLGVYEQNIGLKYGPPRRL